jgi:NAD(P)-dependent dehydrogenase (short-subunit alcohol dehydrogenase family)
MPISRALVNWIVMSAHAKSNLKNRIAVITGGGTGLGKAMALALAAEGATIALVSRNRKNLEAVAAEVHSEGGDARVFAADVTQEDQVRQLEADLRAAFGQVQILINNAGVLGGSPIADYKLEDWRLIMDTNVTAVFLVCRSIVPLMRGQSYGRILNLASVVGHVGIPNITAYSASKAAVMGFTRSLAMELAPDSITVNSISPGPFVTDMTHGMRTNENRNKQVLAGIPLNRYGKPEEVGKLAAYLCSEEAGYVTGTDFLIDGGMVNR